MASNLLLIPQVKPGVSPWSCKVCVIEKHNTRESKSTPGKLYKAIILQDESGNKVQAMAYENDIEIMNDRLKLKSVYTISNTSVSPVRATFKVPDESYRFLWSINRRTLIQDIDNDIEWPIPTDADLTQLRDLYAFAAKSTEISFFGIVMHKLPREFIVTQSGQQKANDFLIIDEDEQPIVLTLWETFASNQGVELEKELKEGLYPIVHGKRIAVRRFKGVSLSTSFHSFVQVNPSSPRAENLTEWKMNNSLKFEEIIKRVDSGNVTTPIANPPRQLILSISAIKEQADQTNSIWMKPNMVKVVDTGMDPYYIGCNYCDKKVNCTEGITFSCMYCGHPSATSAKRFRLTLQLFDDEELESDYIEAIVFNRQVDTLFTLTNTSKGQSGFDFEELQRNVEELKVMVELWLQINNRDGQTTRSYTIGSILGDKPSKTANVAKRKLNFQGAFNPDDPKASCSTSQKEKKLKVD